MKALGAGDGFGFGFGRPARRGDGRRRRASRQGAGGAPGGETAGFPLKQAATAGSLALIGDTIAQLREGWKRRRDSGIIEALWQHDWVRALRMTSYGFLLYGPGSYAWYRMLDRLLPQKNAINLSLKVVLNQLVLGPMVILVIFAWNSLWQGRLSDLPAQYQQKAIPALVDGWKFWTPASVLNFSVVPLDARVAFMSCCSIFWNFYLSTVMKR